MTDIQAFIIPVLSTLYVFKMYHKLFKSLKIKRIRNVFINLPFTSRMSLGKFIDLTVFICQMETINTIHKAPSSNPVKIISTRSLARMPSIHLIIHGLAQVSFSPTQINTDSFSELLFYYNSLHSLCPTVL